MALYDELMAACQAQATWMVHSVYAWQANPTIPKSYYTWKGDDVRQIGTSAQKVQEVYPELVSLNEKTGKLTLDYAKLSIVALLNTFKL